MIWRTTDGSRYFVIPDGIELPAGQIRLVDLLGKTTSASRDALTPFEITETQAHRIAKDQLGRALEEIRGSIDDTLAKYRTRLQAFERTPVTERTTVTPDALPALADLIRELPGAIGGGLSRDEGKLQRARETLKALEATLKASGIDLGGRLEGFADRLHALRAEGDAPK